MSSESGLMRPTAAQIAAASTEAAVVLDGGLAIRAANGLALACFGHPREDLVGMPVEILLAEQVRAEHVEHLRGAFHRPIADPAALGRSILAERADGTALALELALTKVQAIDGPMLLATFRAPRQRATRGASAQADAAAAEARAEWLEILTAGLAHEINNPLTAVLTNLDFALEELGPAPSVPPGQTSADPRATAISALRDARVAARRVSELVRDVKMLSRVDDVHREDVDVAWVVESALDLAIDELKARARVVRVVRDLAETPMVRCNAARLGEALLQLLENAVDAIPPGDPLANEISVATRIDAQGRVLIEIRDTGTGIAPADLPKVFAPFFTRKGPRGGTGLGLAICEGIVTSIGGTLELESTLGVGTTVRVILPSIEGRPARTPKTSATRLRAQRSTTPPARQRKRG
jgi:PAS domain S-box-containing protein